MVNKTRSFLQILVMLVLILFIDLWILFLLKITETFYFSLHSDVMLEPKYLTQR